MSRFGLSEPDGSTNIYEGYGSNLINRQRHMLFSSSQSLADYVAMLSELNQIGSITSREQIINPYDIIDISNYRNTKRGQALYNEDLEYLKLIAQRQEAAYKEWYNSEQQQAERQREAGMNPNLNGVEAGTASDVVLDSGSPLDGIGTTEETIGTIAGVAATAVGTIVSSVATLGALPATISAASATALSATKQAGLLGAQQVGQELANIAAFEGNVYNAIGSNLADATAAAVEAGTKFDFNQWVNNPESHKGVFESYAPSGVTIDDPRYGAAYNRALKNIQKHKGAAYGINSTAAASQTSFAEALSNPYFDNDFLTQLAYLEPVSEAMKQLDALTRQYNIATMALKGTYVSGLDGDLASQNFNETLKASIAKAGFDTDYYEGFDGDEKAALEIALLKSQQIISACESTIKSHYLSIWNDKSKPFSARAGAMYQIMGGTAANWKSWLASYSAANGIITPSPSSVAPSTAPDADVTERMFGETGITPTDAIGYNLGKNFFK